MNSFVQLCLRDGLRQEFLREKQTLHDGFSMFQFWMVPGTKAMRQALSWASLGCRCHRCPTYRCRRCHESLVSCQVLRPRGRCSSVIVGDKIVAGGWGDFGPTWPNFQRAQDETSFQPESNSLELFLLFLVIICYCHCHWSHVSHTSFKAIRVSLKERHPCRQV